MKTRIWNFLRKVRNVLFYISLSTFILNLLLLTFFDENINLHPYGILFNISKVLALTALVSLFAAVLSNIPEEEDKSLSQNRGNIKPVKEIVIFGVHLPRRLSFFVLLGAILGLCFFISFFFMSTGMFWFRVLIIAFIGLYPLGYGIVTWFFTDLRNTDSLGFNAGQDILAYIAGLFLGFCAFVVLSVIALLVLVGIAIAKGIIWLFHHPLMLFLIMVILMDILTTWPLDCNSQKVKGSN